MPAETTAEDGEDHDDDDDDGDGEGHAGGTPLHTRTLCSPEAVSRSLSEMRCVLSDWQCQVAFTDIGNVIIGAIFTRQVDLRQQRSFCLHTPGKNPESTRGEKGENRVAAGCNHG